MANLILYSYLIFYIITCILSKYLGCSCWPELVKSWPELIIIFFFICDKSCWRRDMCFTFLMAPIVLTMSSFYVPISITIQSMHTIFSPDINHSGSTSHITWHAPYFHGLLTMLNFCQVFVIRSVWPLTFMQTLP